MTAEKTNPRLRFLWLFLAGFFVAWTLWADLLVRYPSLTQGGLLRAAVRLLLWVVPSWVFVWSTEKEPVLDALALRQRKLVGLLWGAAGFGLLFAANAIRYGSRVVALKIPADAATWLNPITTAPLAEEILFRGVVLRLLLSRLNAVAALLLSSLLFALIHVPYWAMAGGHSETQLFALFAPIFLLGLFFGFLFYGSKSLWAPLVCHFLNNLFMTAAGL